MEIFLFFLFVTILTQQYISYVSILRDKYFELNCTHLMKDVYFFICYIYIMLTSKNELNVFTLRFFCTMNHTRLRNYWFGFLQSFLPLNLNEQSKKTFIFIDTQVWILIKPPAMFECDMICMQPIQHVSTL